MNIESSSRSERTRTIGLSLAIVVGMICAVNLARWIDKNRPNINPENENESLYVSGKTAKRVSLGFNGLAADWYWMRSLQYVGRKIINARDKVQLDNLGSLDLRLLAPLLDISTTLDPQFMEPYEYAAVVLPDVDEASAINIINKGIKENPDVWQLYQHLGYIYWQRGDFKTASDIYGRGAKLPGAPEWMEAMKAQLETAGGSRDTARQIYERMLQESDDPHIREMARVRLIQIQSFDERDEIRRVLAEYKTRTSQCASSWKSVGEPLSRARLQLAVSGAPLDPTGVPYSLVKDGCDVDLDPRSEIPRR